MTPSLVGLANGHRTADALAGASHAALFGGPLLLTPAESLAEAAAEWFPERRAFLEQVVLYGGTGALAATG